VVRVRDVLLLPTGSHGTFDEYQAHRPAGDPPIGLGGDLSVVLALSADRELEDLVMTSCSPRGHYFVPVRQFGTRHSFVREVDLAAYETDPYWWDHDGTIHVAYQLSRLIRDNGYTTQFTARIVDHEDGAQQVIPGLVDAPSAFVYRAREDRDWLDAADAVALRELIAAYQANEPAIANRVGRALRKSDHASHQPLLEMAALQIVSGLEALVNTGKDQLSKQFVWRTHALARELGFADVTKKLCRRMYDLRSEEAHGREITLFSARPEESHDALTQRQKEKISEVALLHDVLRAAVRRALEDPAFNDHFNGIANVRKKWPVQAGDGTVL
jgi:hypothetical protein